MTIQIIPLKREHLADAADLVCSRFKSLRVQVPILSSRYENEDEILGLLNSLQGECDGVVAIDGSKVVGFLTGFVIPEFLGERTFYSPEWANGAMIGKSRRIYDDMYTQISARWAEEGCCQHAITLMANDPESVEGWHWLGFGLVAIDGVLPLQATGDDSLQFKLRRASIEDTSIVEAFAHALEQHLLASPVFWAHQIIDIEGWLKGSGNAVWLAYEGKVAAACMAFVTGYEEGCRILQDEGTISIISAYTDGRLRNKGIATALLNRGLAWAKDAGYARCGVDFESMNVPAARFWMKHITPVCYSLLRCIDDRIGRSE